MNQYQSPSCRWSFVALQCLLCCCGLSSNAAKSPNIVILFADDLGWGDLSCYGHPTSSTPNLDRMASEGLLFTQFYTAAPICSPSRAALLTGRYQVRSGIYPMVLATDSIGGLPHNETTLAETLKTVGYSTGMVGKWHLGVGEDFQYLPTTQGFDYYLGIPYSNDMCPCVTCFYGGVRCAGPGSMESCEENMVACPLFEDDRIIQQPTDLLTVTATYLNAATSFINAKSASGTPFFLYLAFQHTHQPQFAGKLFTNSSIRGAFGDSLSELDWGVGQVLDTLIEAGVANNTFVFFASDNGPALGHGLRNGNAGLLRCGKATTWEGGQRVPAIAWWPGKIRPGKTTELAQTLDLFPTIAKLVGAELPNVTIDGIDMAPILFGDGKSNRDYVIYYPDNPDPKIGIYAVRWREYKAHYHNHGGDCTQDYPDEVCRGNYSLHSYDPPLLYNLNSDPSEMIKLNVTKYSEVLLQINKIKTDVESTMEWGQSQMDRGTSPSAEPCAQPGCTPFPSCCRTDWTRMHPIT